MTLEHLKEKRLSNPKVVSHAGRERRCAASGQVKEEDELLRLAISPDDELFPDIAAKLPGRGIWISADRVSVDIAIKKGLFNRAAGKSVKAPDDLGDLFESLLVSRALNLLGLARRAGGLAIGYDASHLALKAGKPAWRIEAKDGAADGRGKLDRLAKAAWGSIPVARSFDAEQLGIALGRSHVVHAVLAEGAQSRSFGTTMRKLNGFQLPDSDE
jgi:predicted RNA-binding protein YlxR (DUF448 family)